MASQILFVPRVSCFWSMPTAFADSVYGSGGLKKSSISFFVFIPRFFRSVFIILSMRYNDIMQIALPKFVQHILNKFVSAGYEIYVVGGAVRDVLTGKEVYDWDFTTNATPEQILKVFPQGFYDNQFGTVGLAHESSPVPYEITTYRTESAYTDRRRPDKVEWGKSLEEDLARRDFTMNAMALRQAQGKPSGVEVIDPWGGQEDLKKKLVRAVRDPHERFNEDALRMIRGIRLAAQLGFEIEEETFKAVKKHAQLVRHVAFERVRVELFKLLASKHASAGITQLHETGLLEYILPEFEEGYGSEQKSPGRHHINDVATHQLLSLENCPSEDPLVRFATLIHDIGKPKTRKVTKDGIVTFYNNEVVGARMTKEIAERLRFSKKEARRLWLLVRWHQFSVDERQTDSALRRFIKRVGKENLEDMLDLRTGDRLGGGAAQTSWRLEKFKKRLEEVQKQPFSVADLKVNGKDVMEVLKIKPGPEVGMTLSALFKEIVKDQKKNTREYLL